MQLLTTAADRQPDDDRAPSVLSVSSGGTGAGARTVRRGEGRSPA
ncbi:hypothetical protein HD597_004722 [Nonomuraea thailandensis]|uniref:Uncharacterized protein n=1 Tax=Nonomuraea thailandensis TaxID=1188745 RepID=A0A9X2GHG0_9ACTN|nr:hypothetical protein [Nonomuraea thailandensis]MCP2357702.1 hypothetical protein [Nonomuraea thailandensis]